MQTAGGVNDENVTTIADGVAAGFFHQALDGCGVGLADFAFVKMRLNSLGDDFELLARGGTIDVNGDEQGAVSALLEPVGKLAGGRSLAGTLQSRHEDNGRRLRCELELGDVFAEDGDQFVANDLDDLLGRRQRGHHFLAEGLLADVLDEFLDNVEVDVGFEQRQANFFEGVADVLFGQGALPAEVFEGTLERICKILKHLGRGCGGAGAGREVSAYHARCGCAGSRYAIEFESRKRLVEELRPKSNSGVSGQLLEILGTFPHEDPRYKDALGKCANPIRTLCGKVGDPNSNPYLRNSLPNANL